jgi:uncharacterized RDD family membrane protein YckC
MSPFDAPEEALPVAAPRPLPRRAALGSRLGARGVDGLLLGCATLPWLVVVPPPAPDADAVARALVGLAWAAGIGLGAVAVLSWQWYRLATDGTTFGKRFAGIRVVTADGRPPGFLAGVVVREWVCGAPRLLGGLGGVFTLVDWSFALADEGRTLHDRLAGTRVVRDGSGPG